MENSVRNSRFLLFLETVRIVIYDLLTFRTVIFTWEFISFDNHIRDDTYLLFQELMQEPMFNQLRTRLQMG